MFLLGNGHVICNLHHENTLWSWKIMLRFTPSRFLVVVFNVISWEEKKMGIIATICAVGTMAMAIAFAGWMLTQLFASNK